MPKSRKRGGQKAHNKRVKTRNQKIAVEKKKMQQAYTEMFQQRLEEFQNQYSAMTENNETDEVMVESDENITTYEQ